LAVVLALGMVVAACGDDDDDDAGGSDATSAATTATTAAGGDTATTAAGGGATATSAAAAPTGEAIKVGFINVDSGAVSFPESTAGAKAAEGVINDSLGGIGGRPLEVVYCSVNGTPESSQTCAAKMVEEKVLAVTLGLDFNDSVLVPVFENAKIPIIGGVPAGQDILASKNAFFFQAGLPAVYPGIPYWISENLPDVKKVAILHGDDPTGTFIAESNMKPYFEQLGMEAQLFSESAAAADYTPVVSAALATDPDLITSTFGNVACIGYMKALKSLGYDGEVFHSAGCYDAAIFEAVGLENLEGQYFDFGLYGFYSKDALPADKQPELQLFSDAMAKYSPDTPLAGFPEAAFQQLMNIKAIFEEIGVDGLTYDSIIGLMTDKKVRNSFLAPDWSCDGSAAIAPGVFVQSVCTTEVITYQVEGGEIVQVGEPFNGNYLLQQAK
jgi:branched-chain amino acid transport system substrate-binding protein